VEAVVGMLVFGICCIALYTALASGFSIMRSSREDLQATQLMLDKMEAMRLYRWDQLAMLPPRFAFEYATGREMGGSSGKALRGIIYTGQVILTNAPLAANYGTQMKQITVKVNWDSGGIQQQREISTMVAQNGLYRFVR
jgi:hypothetical protein